MCASQNPHFAVSYENKSPRNVELFLLCHEAKGKEGRTASLPLRSAPVAVGRHPVAAAKRCYRLTPLTRLCLSQSQMLTDAYRTDPTRLQKRISPIRTPTNVVDLKLLAKRGGALGLGTRLSQLTNQMVALALRTMTTKRACLEPSD